MKYINGYESIKKSLVRAGDYTSTKDMLNRLLKFYPNKVVFGELDKNKNLAFHTIRGLYKDIDNLGEGLLSLGLKSKHIAICGENSYNYIISELAIIGGLGVSCPIDKDANDDLFVTLMNKCDAEAIICSSKILDKVIKNKARIPLLKYIFTLQDNNNNLLSLEEIKTRGSKIQTKERKYRLLKVDENKLCKIIFTSGTTGMNKGVMMTQKNIISNITSYLKMVMFTNERNESSMSVLPMHHSTELNTHVYPRLACARMTYINDNIRNVLKNMQIFKPHMSQLVPMMLNTFYKLIWIDAKKHKKEASLMSRVITYRSLKAAHIDYSKRLFKDVYALFGGNIRSFLCGGAMLNPSIVKGFADLGISIGNGYGITECGPLIAGNPNATKKNANQVGKPASNVYIKIIDKDLDGVGELLVKGPGVSSGYYKDEEATKAVFDAEGYFHTGDYGKFTEDNSLILSGRKKYAITLSNGKNICPEEIENLVEDNIKYINEVVVYSVTIGEEYQESIQLCAGIFIKDEEARNKIDKIIKDIRNLNKKIPTYKQINILNIVSEEFEKTSSNKIKRDTIYARHNPDNIIKI